MFADPRTRSGSSLGAPYTTSDFVTAMVTLASPLAPNMSLTQVSPIAFSLSDGVQTITMLTATVSVFEFATGPTGHITQWDGFAMRGLSAEISTVNANLAAIVIADVGIIDGSERSNNSRPCRWTSTSRVLPFRY